MEIERKFLLKDGLPDLGIKPVYASEMETVYLSVDPYVRLRHIFRTDTGSSFYRLTIKGKGDLSREEIETTILQSFYYNTVRFIGMEPIKSKVYVYNIDDNYLYIAEVEPDKPTGFVYSESEFNTEKEALAYKFPLNINIEDVTYNEYYKMNNYWKRTRLDTSTGSAYKEGNNGA